MLVASFVFVVFVVSVALYLVHLVPIFHENRMKESKKGLVS